MTDNTISDSEATTVVQSGTIGAVHLGTGDQHNGPSFNGDGHNINFINGDHHGDINTTIKK